MMLTLVHKAAIMSSSVCTCFIYTTPVCVLMAILNGLYSVCSCAVYV